MIKIAINGFKTAIRIAVNAPTKERSFHFLHEIANSFSSFNNPSGNSLGLKRPHFWRRRRLINAMLKRSRYFMPTGQILNPHLREHDAASCPRPFHDAASWRRKLHPASSLRNSRKAA